MNMNESFSLDDLEQLELEQSAQILNNDDIVVCTCKGMCLRDYGRNACPCKTVGQYCTTACHVESEKWCMNSRRYLETDSSENSDDFDFIRQLSDTESRDNESLLERARGRRGRPPGRGKGRSRLPSRGGRRPRSRSQERRPSRTGQARGAGRGTGRGAGRGASRGAGRGCHLIQEDDLEQRMANQEQQLQNLVDNLDVVALRRLAAELLRRQPAVFADIVNGELVEAGQSGDRPPQANPDESQRPDAEESQQPGPKEPHPPADGPPNWCHCGQCRPMPTKVENKCCCKRTLPCTSTTALFQQLVLDGNVLDLAMRYREDVLALDHPRNNENFRHAAYRQFVLWQHGRLGQGNRTVVPSCCVLAIRAKYPSPNGVYTGYRPSRL